MDYLCSECSMQLSKWEMFLNKKYPVGHLFCEFCQSKHERELIKKIAEVKISVRFLIFAHFHFYFRRPAGGAISHDFNFGFSIEKKISPKKFFP